MKRYRDEWQPAPLYLELPVPPLPDATKPSPKEDRGVWEIDLIDSEQDTPTRRPK